MRILFKNNIMISINTKIAKTLTKRKFAHTAIHLEYVKGLVKLKVLIQNKYGILESHAAMKFHGSEGLYFFFLSDIACISS